MMASRTTPLGSNELNFLKETLHDQQELLQKLYNDLDAERESSATAADEALAMILRLQGEKAAMEMEASQYKRIAEQKMCHAQEMLEIFQELIYQKEMQIASLEFHVQAHKFKLASMGCDDIGACDIQYPDNMLSRKNGFVGETSAQSSIKRGNSLPLPMSGVLSRRASSEGARTTASSPKTLQEIKSSENSIRREHTTGDFNSYWEKIKKLDERVKEFSSLHSSSSHLQVEGAFETPVPCALNPTASTSSLCNPSPDNSPAKTDFPGCPERVFSVQAYGDSPCSRSVQDIFEVPQCSDSHQGGTAQNKEKPNLSLEKESRNGKLDTLWDEVWESVLMEKKLLISPGSNRGSPKPNDVDEKIGWEKRPLLSPGINTPIPKDEKTHKHMLFKHPTFSVADFELQQYNRRLKKLEDDRFVTRGREINLETEDEELRLLREISEKIDSVQADITNWRSKKPLPPENRSLGCFKEVVQCFWP